VIPPDHTSRDHLNEYKEINVDEEIREKWVKEFEQLKAGNKSGEKVIWALIDGFLIYWHKARQSIELLDYMNYLVETGSNRPTRRSYHAKGTTRHSQAPPSRAAWLSYCR
jgi:nicotinamide/nicotinate riboside kinase